MRVGVTPRTELRVGLGSFDIRSTSLGREVGFEAASLGAKVIIVQDAAGVMPNVSLLAASTLPTGDGPFRSSRAEPEAKVALGWSLTQRVAFTANVSDALLTEGPERYGEPAASGSLGVDLTSRLGSYFELFGFFPTAPGTSTSRYLNSGLTYGFGPNLQVDVRAGLGMNNVGGPDQFFGFGIGRRW